MYQRSGDWLTQRVLESLFQSEAALRDAVLLEASRTEDPSKQWVLDRLGHSLNQTTEILGHLIGQGVPSPKRGLRTKLDSVLLRATNESTSTALLRWNLKRQRKRHRNALKALKGWEYRVVRHRLLPLHDQMRRSIAEHATPPQFATDLPSRA